MERKWVFLQFIHRIIVINSLLVTLMTFLAFMACVELFRKSCTAICLHHGSPMFNRKKWLRKRVQTKNAFQCFQCITNPQTKHWLFKTLCCWHNHAECRDTEKSFVCTLFILLCCYRKRIKRHIQYLFLLNICAAPKAGPKVYAVYTEKVLISSI